MALPLVLAGPILRRCHEEEINIWIALSARSGGLSVSLRRASGGPPIGVVQVSEEMQIARQFWIYLVRVKPVDKRFPTGVVLLYDLSVLDETDIERISYPEFDAGSLVIQEGGSRQFRAFYGSCRKLHGPGTDATQAADGLMAARVNNLHMRPHALLLTGDQIYADDVPSGLTADIQSLGEEVVGGAETMPEPRLPWGGRQTPLESIGLSSSAMSNHLLTFGDYCAAYLLAWNPDMWTTSGAMAFPEYHAGTVAMRRLLANLPTYMIFDDHEVTDDWNIHTAWKVKVRKSALGRRILTHGLAAYWLFQGIGNDPARFASSDHVRWIRDHLRSSISGRPDGVGSVEFDRIFLNARHFSFVTPTWPAVVFADTRTNRGSSPDRVHRRWEVTAGREDGFRPAPRLMDVTERGRFDRLLASALARDSRRVVLVTPGPVFGVPAVEEGVESALRSGLTDPLTADFESFHADLHSFIDVMSALLRPGGRPRAPDIAVILSGDVHYGFSAAVSLMDLDSFQRVNIAQFTSSALKNPPTGQDESLLDLKTGVPRDPVAVKFWWRPGSDSTAHSSFTVNPILAQPRGGNTVTLGQSGVDSGHKEVQDRADPSAFKFVTALRLEPAGGKKVVQKRGNIGLLEIDGERVRNELLSWSGSISSNLGTDWRPSTWPVVLR